MSLLVETAILAAPSPFTSKLVLTISLAEEREFLSHHFTHFASLHFFPAGPPEGFASYQYPGACELLRQCVDARELYETIQVNGQDFFDLVPSRIKSGGPGGHESSLWQAIGDACRERKAVSGILLQVGVRLHCLEDHPDSPSRVSLAEDSLLPEAPPRPPWRPQAGSADRENWLERRWVSCDF